MNIAEGEGEKHREKIDVKERWKVRWSEIKGKYMKNSTSSDNNEN